MSHIVLPDAGGGEVPSYSTSADLPTASPGDVAVVITPLTLWVSDGSTWTLLATLNPISGVSDSATIDLALTTNPDGTRTLSASVINASLADAQIAPGAAIALSKLASLTSGRAVVSDGSGVLSVSSVTSIELGYLGGVTSAIQGQIDGKVAKSGDTMTGALTLPGAPTTTLHAATKGYVDDVGAAVIPRVASYLDLPASPVAGDMAFTKDTQTLWEFGGVHWHEIGSGYDSTAGTGLLSGGALGGVGTGQVTISAGAGAVLDFDHVPYAARSIVTWDATSLTPGADGTRYIVGTPQLSLGGRIYATLSIADTATPPTREDARSKLLFGSAVVAGGVVTSVRQGGDICEAVPNQLNDLMGALGLFLQSGCAITPNANKTIARTAGVVFAPSISYGTTPLQPHAANISAQNPVQLYMMTRSSSPGSLVTDIDVANYDLAGTITTVSGGRCTNLRIFQHYDGRCFCQYGQTTYGNLAEALDAIQNETFVVNPLLGPSDAVLLATLSVRQSATNLQTATIARIVLASKFGVASGSAGLATTTLQQAYDNSSSPEVTTDTTRGAIQLRQGSGAPSTLLQGESTAGTATATLDSAGVLSVAPAGGLQSLASGSLQVGTGANTTSLALGRSGVPGTLPGGFAAGAASTLGAAATPISVTSGPAMTIYASSSGGVSVWEGRMVGSAPIGIRTTSIGGTEASPSNTSANTSTMAIYGRGRFGGTETDCGAISIINLTTSDNTGSILFYTGNGSGSIVERARFASTGLVVAPYSGTGTRMCLASSGGAVTTPNASATVAYGTYTPTATAVANITGLAPQVCTYQRLGNMVAITGEVQGALVASDNTASVLTISLPGGWTAAGAVSGAAGGSVAGNSSANGGVGGAVYWASSTTLGMQIRKSTGYSTSAQSFYFKATFFTTSA